LTVTPVDLPAGRADLKQLEGMASRGAADQLNELRAIVRLHEARELFDQGQREKSMPIADELLILSPAAARVTLGLPECVPFRTAIVDDHRNRFDQSLAAGRISEAIKAAAGVGEIEPAAQGWLAQGLTGEKLRALPPSAWAAMPAEIISALPSSVIADLPAAALKSLPAATILALPPIQNSIGMELKLLPPGVFAMGDEGNKDDAIRRVTLTRPFFIGVHEVTNAQWSAATETDVPSPWKDGSLPVANADWDDADFFCGRLAQLPDEAKKGRFYRLPTEAEWEYACRAGTSTPMFFGSDTSQLENYAWFADNSGRRPLKSRAIQALDVNERVELLKGNDCRTHPVGSKQRVLPASLRGSGCLTC
jgi:formylglycine-generating enzyme required for sulfatase activity